MFFNNAEILIKKSNRDLNIFKLSDKIIYEDIKANTNEIYKKELMDGDYSFVVINIDIDENDNVYGILNDKKGKLLSISIEDDIYMDTILKYDCKNFFIKFPYIKNFSKENHIFYYLVKKENPNISDLIHIYRDKNFSMKNIVDYIPYNIMSNFEVIWDKNIPILFYFKHVDEVEELFVSVFNIEKNKWSEPFKITDSKKSKIYLSVIKDVRGYYNIVFAEENEGKYYCQYIKGKLKYNKFEILESTLIKTELMCLFPHLINHRNELYIQWGEYNNLYTCKSVDLGATWGKTKLNNPEADKFLKRYIYKSNNIEERDYIVNSIFTDKEDIDMLDYKITDSL